MSKKETYRGEDKTLEMIRERAKDILGRKPGLKEMSDSEIAWNHACKELAEEFENQGLEQTAKTILSHKVHEPLTQTTTKQVTDHAQKIAKNSEYGKINGAEAILPQPRIHEPCEFGAHCVDLGCRYDHPESIPLIPITDEDIGIK